MIVMKFGGSSVESADAIRRVAGIVKERVAQKPVVVVSAMGKTTNALLAVAKAAVEDDSSYPQQLEALRAFHLDHAVDLAPDRSDLISLIGAKFRRTFPTAPRAGHSRRTYAQID